MIINQTTLGLFDLTNDDKMITIICNTDNIAIITYAIIDKRHCPNDRGYYYRAQMLNGIYNLIYGNNVIVQIPEFEKYIISTVKLHYSCFG